jgi:hypothetical protein
VFIGNVKTLDVEFSTKYASPKRSKAIVPQVISATGATSVALF